MSDLRTLLKIITVMKSNTTISPEHVADIGSIRNASERLVENLKGRNRFGEVVVDSIMKMTFVCGEYNLILWHGSSWLKIGTSGGYRDQWRI
jgi:hypothetical protein